MVDDDDDVRRVDGWRRRRECVCVVKCEGWGGCTYPRFRKIFPPLAVTKKIPMRHDPSFLLGSCPIDRCEGKKKMKKKAEKYGPGGRYDIPVGGIQL